jgi:hypothetical protein
MEANPPQRRYGPSDRRLIQLQAWQRDLYVDQLRLGDMTPDERDAFPLVMRAALTEMKHRAIWARRSAWFAGLGAAAGGGMAPGVVEWVRTLVGHLAGH